MSFARLTTIENIFEPRLRKERFVPAGKPVSEYTPQEWRGRENIRWILNGEDVGDSNCPVSSGDQLIGVVIPTAPLVPFIIPILVSLVVAGISYGIQALTAPSAPTRQRNPKESATYGFDGIVSTVRPGTPLTVVYGTHRFGGHIIQQFVRPAQELDDRTQEQTGQLHTLLGMGYGPIAGISDVRIDNNPVTDFQGVLVETRQGDLYQSPIRGFENVVNQRGKDILLSKAAGSQVFTAEAELDFFEVTLRFRGGLYALSNNGSLKKKTVEVRVEYRELGSPDNWTLLKVQQITGSSRNQFDFFITNPSALARAIYEIRLTRLTNDDSETNVFSEINVIALSEILDNALSYPLEALAAIRQMPTNRVSGAIPNYNAIVKGRILRIYSDADTYTEAWSDNPAWIFLDFLTSRQYGAGRWFSLERIVIEDLIYWASKCDEMKPAYAGGPLEKQFTCNLVVDGSLSTFDTIKAICTAGRACFLQRGDKWGVKFLEVSAPMQLFQMSRIKSGSFEVTMPRRSETANVITGEFSNEENNYETDTVPKADPTIPAGEGQVPGTINLTGITTPSRVARILNYTLLANRLERRIIAMDVGLESLAVEAADVFAVSHDVPGWGFSGRLLGVDAGGAQVELDRDVTIEAGKEYELTVIHQSDTIDVVAASAAPGVTRVLSVTPGWTETLLAGVDYAFGEIAKSRVLYRCTKISRGSKPNRRRVEGKEYHPDVFGDNLDVPTPASSSRLQDPGRIPDAPTNLVVTERIEILQDGGLRDVLDVFFTLPQESGARGQVFWRRKGETAWDAAGEPVSRNVFTIVGGVESPGVTYEISVVSVSPSGNRKSPENGLRTEVTTTGVTRRPDKVAGFRVDRTVSGLVFTWLPLNPLTNPDLDFYEIRLGATWETAALIGRAKSTTLETGVFVKGQQQFLCKAVNRSRIESFEPAVIVTNIEGRIGENIVVSVDLAPTWSGTKDNLIVTSGHLVLDTDAQVVAWRNQPQSNPRAAIFPGGRSAGFRATGSFTSAPISVVGLNAVRMMVSVDEDLNVIDAEAYWTAPDAGQQWWTSTYGQTRSWAGLDNGKVKIRYELRFSTSGSNDADFGPWLERAQQVEVTAKWAQLRFFVEVLDPALTVEITHLIVNFDVPDILDAGAIQSSASAPVAVTFNKAYNNPPKVSGTIIGATIGEDDIVTSITSSGFTLAVRDAGNNLVARTYNWIAAGY